ncbi:MAG: c-type cytochrome [Saprospiraceae bacterium]
MKRSTIISITCTIFLALNCNKKSFTYVYPPNIAEKEKPEFDKFIKLGSKLYKTNCSACHGVQYASQDGGRQFTENQIRNYAVNIKIRNETHKFTRAMSKDDIDAICVYLKYKN